MIGRIVPRLLVVAALAAGAGCASSREVIKPRGTVAIALDAAKPSASATVELINRLVITMPPTEPGLGWQISLHDTRYLKLWSDFAPPSTAEAGATVSFVATAMGTTRLRFVLVPATTGPRPAEQVSQLELSVTIR